ncbi:MAG TPA: adenylate/guanylate cyclase domain-containing protein [Gaiellaceae bacterium]|nr:adenylate/guanylate cyclase domain-containing protein [Gaiellaceae bacterium]
MTRCPRCAEENPERARFCLNCGLPLETAPPTVQLEERKLVTAIFVDLVGSTAHAERHDPEDVSSRLRAYHDRLRSELERFGGTVEKFIGDAVVALFGALIANEDDPERALRAAFAIREAIGALNAADAWLALEVRIGIATGEALVRTQAATASGETLAMGDVMNTAARIQSAASPGAVLVDRATYEVTRHAVQYASAKPLVAKGKTEPVEVWEADGLKELPARRHSNAPFVGRQRELAVLDHQWRRVRGDGRPATALLLAEAGTGKTRLLAAFAERTGAPVYWGRCLAYGEAGAYGPVAELLVAAGADRAVDEAPPDTDGLRTISAALDAVVGVGSSEGITEGELRWGVRRALELVAAEPIVLAFDDLHWADPALAELVLFLEKSESPLLILGSARPELAASQPTLVAAGDRRLVVSLPPLTSAESHELVSELLGSNATPQGLESVLAAAEGNPLFLEESVHMLAEGGGTATVLAAPPSLRSMIGARLDRLPDLQRHLSLRASVVGRSFWPGAVASLNGVVEGIEGALEALSRLDVADERSPSTIHGEREFAFKHDLIREVAYGRLPKGLRVELHVRCAEWIALQQEQDEFVEIGAHHLEQACRLAGELERSPIPPPVEAAVEALRAAALKAERREGLREADRLYERALRLVADDHPEIAVELRLRRARVLAALGDLDEAEERFRAVVGDAGVVGRADLRGAALVGLGNVLQKQGRGAEARVSLGDANAIAEETGDTKLQVQTLFELATLARDFAGDHELAVSELERALELAAGLDDRALRAEGQLRLGFLLFADGALEQAEAALVRSAAIGSELGSRRDETRATFMQAYTAFYRGRVEEAERLALGAQEWFERTGDSYFRIQNLRALGRYAFARGDVDEAVRRLEAGLELAQPSGGWLVAELSGMLAEILARAGRLEEARAVGTAALASVPDGDPQTRAGTLVANAYVAAASGDAELTRARTDEALDILARHGGAIDSARARVTLGQALALAGDEDRAAAQLRLAGEESARAGATLLLAEAEIALSSLELR